MRNGVHDLLHQQGQDSDWNMLRVRAQKEEHEQQFYLRMLQQHFQPGMRWLDAGCGHSFIPDWLRDSKSIEQKFLDEANVIVGADIDVPSLTAPSRMQRVACHLEKLAFQNETFDLVSCNMVIEHLLVPEKVFAEFFRVLRTGGLVLILTPNIYHWTSIVSMLTPVSFHRQILKRLWHREPADVFPTFYRCNTARRIKKLLGTSGFSTTNVYMLPGRQRLIDFGMLFYPEYFLYKLSLRFKNLRENLCVIAQK
jgi:ubiquinone/menaquinone biosynthesis C-methylase UbiE